MRLRSFCVVGLLATAGCRQADGSQPTETGEVPNRIYDLSRDLANLAAGSPEAPMEFTDDLKVFIDEDPQSQKVTDELARRVIAAGKGRPLTDQAGAQLARQLWLTVAARELSERQREKLKEDLKAALTQAGAPEQNAQEIVAQAEEVQKTVTSRSRRWFEFF